SLHLLTYIFTLSLHDALPISATAILWVKTAPTLERIMLGLYKSVLGLAIKTASTFAASAVRRIAPMFPGFSNDSKTIISGFSGRSEEHTSELQSRENIVCRLL